MDKRLKDKLNRSKKDESERGALTLDEYRAILKMLKAQGGLIAVQDYALLRFAVSTGLRAAELVNLTWECFSTTDEGWAVTFVGKGQKRATIQVEEESFRACRRAFKARWGRAPRPTEKVFNSTTTEGITKAAIHIRIKGIGEQAKAAGILRPNFNLSTHTLRHTTATRLIALGCDLRTIQLHMRHSSLATTQRYLNERVDLRPYWKKMNGEAA